MRKLTINRKKSFVASLVRIFTYIETKEIKSTENILEINNIKYKKVGTISNGKSSTIDIPKESTNIMIAYSNNFPKFYNVRHTFSEGNENVVINTRQKFSPFKGNPFIIES
ncbi:MAG: hypothetical protein PHQ32_06545 [Firmicutes bacterium]|nr:hypothetical protein [Bacillota bacterium]